MKFESVLVEREDKATNTLYGCSGILFAEKYVLITSHIISSILRNDQNKPCLDDLTQGVLHFNVYKSLSFNVVRKSDIDSDLLNFKKASVLAVFLCSNIWKSCHIFTDYAADCKSNQNKNLLSLFFILNIENEGGASDLKQSLETWFRSVLNEDLSKGDEICLDSVPFGNRNFLNTYSRGIVSNIIGESDCLVFSDCSSTPGCEGSPAYKSQNFRSTFSPPIAITMSSLSSAKGEWIGLTFLADIRPLLLQLLEPTILLPARREIAVDKKPHFKVISTIESTLAQVYSGTSTWGTAILVDKSRGIFVTNSHVLENAGKVHVYWKKKSASCRCIYKTPEDSLYDIALLKINDEKSELLEHMKAITFSEKAPRIGDLVYSAGYSLFPKDLDPTPIVSTGQVSHYSPTLLKTTCFVHAGSSGGAILNPEGHLVGIIVCNIKTEITGTVYPRCNLAIPILAVSTIIKDFLRKNDSQVLQKLNVNRDSSRWFLQAKL